jgi:topoisomerase-4 subunit B
MFIGENIRLEPVILSKDNKLPQLLEYYMGKNTPDRQVHIVNNLRVELDTEDDMVKTKEESSTEEETMEAVQEAV